MCLILFANQIRTDFPLVLVANRDEFLDRPTQPVSFWDEQKQILAGRDLRAGGTWLGVTRSGRISAITNFREPASYEPDARSRGELVTRFLSGAMEPEEYVNEIETYSAEFNGFNLLVWMHGRMAYTSNRLTQTGKSRSSVLRSGLYGLSNHLLDTPWPKVNRGKQALEKALERNVLDPEELFNLSSDQETANDAELPQTGVPLEQERALSSMFIRMDGYGTRSTSLVFLDKKGRLDFYERSFAPDGSGASTEHFTFNINP